MERLMLTPQAHCICQREQKDSLRSCLSCSQTRVAGEGEEKGGERIKKETFFFFSTFSNSVSYLAQMSSISREDDPNHAPSDPGFCQNEGGSSLTENTCSEERAKDWCCPRLYVLHTMQPTCTVQPSSPWAAMPCAGEPRCWPNSPVGWGKLLNTASARARQRDHKLLWWSTSQRRHSCCPLTTTVMKSFRVTCGGLVQCGPVRQKSPQKDQGAVRSWWQRDSDRYVYIYMQ